MGWCQQKRHKQRAHVQFWGQWRTAAGWVAAGNLYLLPGLFWGGSLRAAVNAPVRLENSNMTVDAQIVWLTEVQNSYSQSWTPLMGHIRLSSFQICYSGNILVLSWLWNWQKEKKSTLGWWEAEILPFSHTHKNFYVGPNKMFLFVCRAISLLIFICLFVIRFR